MRVSDEFRAAIKLNSTPSYRIAQAANLDPSTLSKLINGITRIRPMDERVIKVGKILGLSPQECFHETDRKPNGRPDSQYGSGGKENGNSK